eukprot:scaffold183862_cov19-Tisochrysis_lutea.AAC.1
MLLFAHMSVPWSLDPSLKVTVGSLARPEFLPQNTFNVRCTACLAGFTQLWPRYSQEPHGERLSSTGGNEG